MEEHHIVGKPGRKMHYSTGVLVIVGVLLGIGIIVIGGYVIGVKSLLPFVKPAAVVKDPVPVVVQAPLPADQKIEGKVTNLISDQAVADVSVSTGDVVAKTDSNGSFSLSVKAGSAVPLTITKDGFQTQTVAFDKAATITLVPEGKVIFISNRDGKRGIYQAALDGSDQKPLISRIGDSEDYNVVISPHERLLAFLSTRNKRLSRGSYPDPALYLARYDGSNLQKVSDFFSVGSVQWSPDGKYLAWIGLEKENDTGSKLAIRDVETGATIYNGDPGESVSNYAFKSDDSQVVMTKYNNSNYQQSGIYVANGNGTSPKKVSDSTGGATFNKDGNIEFSQYKDNTQKYYVWYHDSGETKEIKKDTNQAKLDYAVKSPDRSRVAFVDNRDGKSNIYTAKPDGSDEKQLSAVNTASGSIMWSQDGNYITFSVVSSGESARYIVATSGTGTARKIVDEYNGGGMGY